MAFQTVGRAIGSFHPRAMPTLARHHYQRELAAWIFLPIMMGAVEGRVVGVIAKNAFEGFVEPRWLNLAVAIITGAPAFSNIASIAWAWMANGRHKIRFVVMLQVITVGLVGMIAFTPRDAAGLLILTVGVVGARVCWSGVAMLRSTVWRANYARAHRASVAGKLAAIQALVIAITGLSLGWVLDHSDADIAYRLVYPVAAVCGLVGAALYSRMRVRGHRRLLEAERRDGLSGMRWISPIQLVRLFAEDRAFGWFMGCQFVFGIGNMMTNAPLVYAVREQFGFGNLSGIVITAAIPVGLMPLTIPVWARLLDRVHIIRFRAFHSWMFVGASLIMLAASLTVSVELLILASVLQGGAFGGGVLAWNLGHHDFAARHRAAEYMSVHLMLTGVRGFIAMAISWSLWEALDAWSPGSGPWVFAICAALSATGALGFVLLSRRVGPNKGRQD